MTSSRNLVFGLGVCFMVCGAALQAGAQTSPKAEISVGYQLLNLSSEGESESLNKGWYVDVAGNLNPSVAIVAEVGGSYKSVTESVTAAGVSATATVDVKLHEFMGGMRVSSRANPTVVPFGQVLAGGVSGSVNVSGSSSIGSNVFSISLADSGTNFALQFGGGVNIQATEKVGVRIGADYLRVFGDNDGANLFRIGAGIVLPLN